MESLFFLKFWKPNNTSTISAPSVEILVEEEDDSFFDLELSFDIMNKTQQESNKLESKEATMPKPTEVGFSKPTLCLSPADSISKRKVLPIEPISKPQSPIALLKSAPKFGVLMFKKTKATTRKKTREEAESRILMETQKQKRKEGNLFAVKLINGDESPNPSKLTRENSSKRSGKGVQNQSSEDLKTERFSKDVIQKYLSLIKPLYSKVSKRYTEKAEVPMASPASSPVVSVCSPRKKQGNIPAGFRGVCKNLGKSKSATTMMASASPVNRRDDSLLLQNDGIQSAILHCKRSFNSSRDSASLSRSVSDSSSMNSFSTDSSMLSRFASESNDKSARSSIEE